MSDEKKSIYRVIFHNQGNVIELYAHEVSQNGLYAFVEIGDIIFGERSKLVVDPSEEQLKSQFSGVKRTWLWAIGIMLLSAVALGLAPNLSVAVVAAVIAGAGLGGIKVCREMILAGLVDRSLERTGRRQEGVYYSLNRFIGQLSRILEALALVLLGLLFGYVSGDDPGPNPESAFRFLMGVLPFICIAAAWLLARTLHLEDDRAEASP